MDAREANLGKREKQLKIWGAMIGDLAAKADDRGAEVDVTHRRDVDNLQAKLHEARARLDELRDADGDEWEAIENGVDSAWDKLRIAFRDLRR